MVTVKNGDKLTLGLFQSVVNIARLGVFVSRTCNVLNADLFGKGSELGSITVIKNVDSPPILWPIDT